MGQQLSYHPCKTGVRNVDGSAIQRKTCSGALQDNATRSVAQQVVEGLLGMFEQLGILDGLNFFA